MHGGVRPWLRARLERHIQSRAASPFLRFFESEHLGVLQSGPGVISAADDFAVSHHYGAHGRIGSSRAPPARGELQSLFQMIHVSQTSDATKFAGSNGSRSSTCSPTPM